MVHILPHKNNSMFDEYSDNLYSLDRDATAKQHSNRHCMGQILSRQLEVVRITREKRGKGVRRKVSRNAKLPVSFAGFLQDNTNKEELFALLSEEVASRGLRHW